MSERLEKEIKLITEKREKERKFYNNFQIGSLSNKKRLRPMRPLGVLKGGVEFDKPMF